MTLVMIFKYPGSGWSLRKRTRWS